MKKLVMICAAFVCAGSIGGCESGAQREARVKAVLDAQLPGLEVCARLYDLVEAAFAEMDAAVEAQSLPAFVRANAAVEESKGAFFDCLTAWTESSRKALDEAGMAEADRATVVDAWTAEQWSRLGFDRLLGDDR